MLKRLLMIAVVMLLIAVWGSVWAQTGDELIPIYEAEVAAFNAHDIDAVVAFRTDDIVLDYVPIPPPLVGKEATAQFHATLFTGPKPGIQLSIQRVLASGNILVAETVATGTHTVEWMGIPPTGNNFELPHLSIYEYEGDKIKKETTYTDNVTLLVQLGVMPASELPPLEPSFELPDPEPTELSPVEASAEKMSRWNARDLAGVSKFMAVDDEIFVAALGTTVSRETFMAMQELVYFLAFPDIQVEILRGIDLGDGWALQEVLYTGTHDGPYLGIPATGNSMQARAALLYHYEGGLETHLSAYFDNLGVLVQIGAVPPPGTSLLPTTWGQVKSLFQE